MRTTEKSSTRLFVAEQPSPRIVVTVPTVLAKGPAHPVVAYATVDEVKKAFGFPNNPGPRLYVTR